MLILSSLDDDDERFVVGDSLILKDFGRVQQKKINFGVFLFLNFSVVFVYSDSRKVSPKLRQKQSSAVVWFLRKAKENEFSILEVFFFIIFFISGFVFLDLSLCSCCSCSRHTWSQFMWFLVFNYVFNFFIYLDAYVAFFNAK